VRISKIEVNNFRLLRKVELMLEDRTTVIVGRNNSGKTSLTEIFRRVLSDSSPAFKLEDFSTSSRHQLWDAFRLWKDHRPDNEVRQVLPQIELFLTVNYDPASPFGSLAGFIVDIDSTTTEARISITYRLKDGDIAKFFKDIDVVGDGHEAEDKATFYAEMKERVPSHYGCFVLAIDPKDPTNQGPIELV
jgi:putative ATP-dependent endonuclease of OLD family